LNSTATRLEKLASPGAYYLGGGLFLVGRIAGWNRIADLGLHATESVMLAEGIGFVLKRAIGRARPYVSNTAEPQDFSIGTGFGTGDRRSFPSGHTYTAFAMASAVTSEVRAWSPKSTWFVAPLMYGGAAAVGLSRMYHNQHWASDIVLGAAVGTFSGLKLVRYMHGHDTRADRLFLGSPIVRRDHDRTDLGWQIQF
jgi:membrane-associated phospholipid phosphatase